MNTLESLRQQAKESKTELTANDIRDIISRLAPNELNSLILDEETPVRRYEYCYIHARGQSVSHKTEVRTVACDEALEQQINTLANAESERPYVKLAYNSLIEALDAAPKFNTEGFLGNARKKMSNIVSGSVAIDHKLVDLTLADGQLAEQQPLFLIKSSCKIDDCPRCEGKKIIEETDKSGIITKSECNACKGLGRVATVAFLTTKISSKEVSILLPLNGEIDNLKESTFETHKGHDTTPCRMATHVNSIDEECYDEYITPYLEHIHDNIGIDNALEDIYYRIIPCYLFQYRSVLTGDYRAAVLVDPFQIPELIFNLTSTGSKLATGMRDTMKGIGQFFGRVSQSKGHKERSDLLHSARLMIAVTVSDGSVSETEKQSLLASLDGLKVFSSSEQQSLIELLNGSDSNFLTDDDYRFKDKDTAQTTLIRLQQIAAAHDTVCDAERDIIERLRLSI